MELDYELCMAGYFFSNELADGIQSDSYIAIAGVAFAIVLAVIASTVAEI